VDQKMVSGKGDGCKMEEAGEWKSDGWKKGL
jgi:hypothetical protein